MTSTTCSSCSGASPPMPDRPRRGHRRISLAWPLLLALVALVALAPGAVLGVAGARDAVAPDGGRVSLLAPPAETCKPGETMGAGGFSDICGAPGSGGGASGGLNLGGLLPIVAILVVGGVIALIAAFVVLRRTSAPLVPADPGEWWACRTCGKNNVVGSARCYACGAWQR
jgi:hypothetical protein